MAHHQHQRPEGTRRSSAMQSLLKMFNLSNAPTLASSDEEHAEVDEPPDRVGHLTRPFSRGSVTAPKFPRRESLLTRAIMGGARTEDPSPTSPNVPNLPRGLSTVSSHSTVSMASTAELTSDGDLTSPNRSATPSPPLPSNLQLYMPSRPAVESTHHVMFAPATKVNKPAVTEGGEAEVEKTLGRKRCIMFACGRQNSHKAEEAAPIAAVKVVEEPEPQKRKCRLTFMCPSRQESQISIQQPERKPRRPSPAPEVRRTSSSNVAVAVPVEPVAIPTPTPNEEKSEHDTPKPVKSPPTFHEFGNSQDETDAWVDKLEEHKEKLTVTDCMKKEMAIRQIGEEAEEEAEAEEREQEELENETEDVVNEDDFAPSDESDAGNESDDEGGFAESDDESDAGSDYRFWAPSTTTAATSTDNLHLSHFSSKQRLRSSSLESVHHSANSPPLVPYKFHAKGRPSKVIRMRPSTPELPDSTDFVCGTLDEDRPLEAAYISCREMKKREKHVPIPQDIDPSFPTTDPEDNDLDEEDDDGNQDSEPLWLKDQFKGFEDELRDKRKSLTLPFATPMEQVHQPQALRPVPSRRGTYRSPPPKTTIARSPAPRRLFTHSPQRNRSPPPHMRLRSPRGSPTEGHMPVGLTINRLAQRPMMERTASLPHTPNPFFRNFKIGSPSMSNVASGAVTPVGEEQEPLRTDLHVRGPVDIVIGLEKKRQKRKEKFWRQHCRKLAKEQAERKLAKGRGAQRMKELGLECAERTRGYGLGQPAQLVISL